jgi:hypothetical protein
MKAILVNCVLFALALLLGGCFEQKDILTFEKNGKLSFVSEITIRDENNEFSFADIISETDKIMEDLQNSGWELSKEVISEKRPYRMRISGSGFIDKVGKKTDFYEFTKIRKNEYEIVFMEPVMVYQSNRQITVKNSILFDQKGDKIERIKDVDSSKHYLAKFNLLKERP